MMMMMMLVESVSSPVVSYKNISAVLVSME